MRRTASSTEPDGFLSLYTDLRAHVREHAGEPASRYAHRRIRIREEVVRCLWFGAHFRQDELCTDDGQRIEIISPGWWNVESGPDFRRAELLMEHQGRVIGDVEVHTHARAWWEHGHHRQPAYNDVRLHVVLWDDAPKRPAVRENGETLPQLTLCNCIDGDLAELAELFDLDGEAGCGPPVRPAPERPCTQAVRSGDWTPRWLGTFLDAAGDHRFLAKTASMARAMDGQTVDEALYHHLAEALGYKNNRLPFLQLARRLPLETLRHITPADAPRATRIHILESALLGVAGLLSADEAGHADAPTAQRLDRLRRTWSGLPRPLHAAAMTPAHWTLAGTRPANRPARRIAALAALYGECLHEGLFRRLRQSLKSARPASRRRADTVMRDALASLLTQPTHPFWSYHLGPESPPQTSPVALIGRQRAHDIMVNVLLPALLARAHRDGDEALAQQVFTIWSRLPGAPPNCVVQRMVRRLAPDEMHHRKSVLSTFRRQQGLQQIHGDCCLTDDGCSRCLLRRGAPGPDFPP